MVLEAIKDFYYSLEEKWYSFWDAVDKKIPVYGVIDAVDTVIPSFLLFLLIIFLLIIFGAFVLISANQEYSATFTIKTNDNKPVYDTLIFAELMQGDKKIQDLNARTDAEGAITFIGIKQGQELAFDINISKGVFSQSFPVNENLNEIIKLKAPPVVFKEVLKKIFVKTSSGFNPTEEIQLNFSCENSSIIPQPETATFDATGPVEVTEPVNCRLQATISNPKYKQKTYLVNSTLYDLYLEPNEQTLGSLKIKIRSNGYPINDTSFKIKLTGANTYETETRTASEATISVQAGTYFLSISDPRNSYGIVTTTVDVNKATEIVMEVSKTIKSRVTITTVDELSGTLIVDAIVTAKDSYGREVASTKTDSDGRAVFTFRDLGTYKFAAKKLGDLNGGYFPKEIEQELTGDMNVTMELGRITSLNAGKVKIKVIDQDGLQVINAKVMLKYKENDGIVELYQEKNYSLTDLNGEAEFIAGKVEGIVYAYAIKGPFIGSSTEKLVAIDRENVFNITMQVGSATIKLNVLNEAGDQIDGTAEIMTIDGKMIDEHGLVGIVSVEKGKATRGIKAGQTIYVKLKAETYEDYYTVPIVLWPDKTYAFNVTMLKQISEPEIKLIGIYNENDALIQTMAAGKKYYAKFNINSDKEYNEVLFHFRAGKQTMLENDVMAIDSVEGANISSETRGTTYDPEKGYSYDSEHTTDGLAKWSNTLWRNFGQGTREVKVWFRISKTAPPNKELQFFYRGNFDNTRLPPSNAQQDFYADTYQSNVYYVGTEAVCEEGFCSNSEWLYSKKDDLYIDPPYAMKQITSHTYHVTFLNNSDIDYGKNSKPVYLNITVVGDEQEEKRVKIKSYKIKDSVGTTTNDREIYKAENIELNNFEKNTTIDIEMTIEGMKEGAEIIRFELKSEGRIIYTKETSFEIVKEKEFTVAISPQFIPALMNTQIEVDVTDEKGDYLPGAIVKSYAKEPGFEQYMVDSQETDRLGRAVVDSGALFQKTKVIVEITKEGYSRQMFSLLVSDQIIAFTPEEILVALNTFSKREEIKQVTFANLSKQNLIIKSLQFDAKFKDTINEDAMNGYFEEIANEDRTVKAEDTLDIDLLRIRLANSITQDNFIEPITVQGSVKVIFEQPELHLTYDVNIPLTVTVSSEANPGEDCIILKPGKTTAVTEKAQARFDFEMINACASDNVNIPLEALSVTSPTEIPGIAEISIRNSTGSSVGRTALDGGKRKVLDKIGAGEKLFGTLTFAPGTEALGKAVSIQLSFEAKFQDKVVKSNPGTVTYTVNVVNLKECMSITGDAAPVEFKEKAKITIDASSCLGQTIDVILCKNDSGCSGGVEGKISLSKKAFTLQGKSQEIEAYGPSLPGSYGITVHARARGTAGFTFIGEAPVSFLEPEGKYFNLNKFELNVVGAGSQDSILLTNKMLTETVNVKADECIWGKEDADFDWTQAVAGAMMGAALGNMIGSTWNPGHSETTTETPDKPAETDTTKTPPTKEDKSVGGLEQQSKDLQSQIDTLTAGTNTPGGNLNDTEVKQLDSLKSQKSEIDNQLNTAKSWSGEISNTLQGTKTTSDILTLKDGDSITINGTPSKSTIDSVPIKVTSLGDNLYKFEGSGVSQTYKITDYTVSESWDYSTYTSHTIGVIPGPQYNGAISDFSSKVGYANSTSGSSLSRWTSNIFSWNSVKGGASATGSGLSTAGSWAGTVGSTAWDATKWTGSQIWDGTKWISSGISNNVTKGWTTIKNTWSSSTPPKSSNDTPTVKNTDDQWSVKSLDDQKVPVAHFGSTTTTSGSFNWFQASTTIIGAVIGGYLMGNADLYECADHFQTVPYDDFVILLQGTTVGVTPPSGSEDENGPTQQTVPPDAGELTFSLEGIGSEWDFTDAQYSSEETVALKFTNDSLNDPQPRYGTLTIGATVHNHGKQIHSVDGTNTSTSTGTEFDYDVQCFKATFGNYWVGAEEDAGLCNGVSESTYSQKYHLRVLSGEPSGEEAYIKKANSCYFGALTGATGKEALPRVKLDWSWDAISADQCDYMNPEYVYCDATQFLIALTKKLANLDEFMANNGSKFSCPPDIIQQQVTDTVDEINSQKLTVAQGFVGIEDITMSVDTENNKTTATVKLKNNTSDAVTTYMSIAWKGEGEPVTDVKQWTVPAGESETTFEADTPKYEGIYFFTAVVNGPGSTDKKTVSRAFINREMDNNCWMPQTTKSVAGLPGLMYYVANSDGVTYTDAVKDETDLYNTINFGVYLTKDAFTEDFFNDFKQHYRETLLQEVNVNSRQREIVDYLTSGNFKIKKKFSGDNTIEPGLYDVYVNLNAKDNFRVIDGNNTNIEVTLLLVKKPSVDSPFYSMPFDGVLGEKGGRQGYGSVYKNNDEKEITISNFDYLVSTFSNASSNGVTNITTKTKTNFEALNSSVASRGQLASATVSGSTAELVLTPNYATPIIAKQTLQGTSGNMAFSVENTKKAVSTGGNLSYWTGAAKSKDFYGSNAVEVYSNSPDYRLSKLGENVYGFEFNDATRAGSMYLKSVFFIPHDESRYGLISNDAGTSFWTTSNEFNSTAELLGIPGMKYNSLQNNSYMKSLQDLFDAVQEGKVCVSSDGSSTSFWWNPAVLENTTGSTNSLANKELELVGTN